MMKRRQREDRGQRQEQARRRLPLPSEVLSIVGDGSRCENIGLWLDRYLPVNDKWELTQDAKSRKQVFRMVNQPKLREIVDALNQRQEALLRWYERQGFEVRKFEAKPFWRFVVGLGAAHVLETGITLHRIFGLPIIPASGLKGAARAYARLVEGKTEDDREFLSVFGTTEQAGKIVFLDAIPLSTPKFELDIMNPHYPDYYREQGGKPPADWQSPNPVFFLTVSETPYLFAVASRTKGANAFLDKAEQWLKGALRELGIGAKTSADYGYWIEVRK